MATATQSVLEKIPSLIPSLYNSVDSTGTAGSLLGGAQGGYMQEMKQLVQP